MTLKQKNANRVPEKDSKKGPRFYFRWRGLTVLIVGCGRRFGGHTPSIMHRWAKRAVVEQEEEVREPESF
jgi:hypothetical protein